MCRVRILVGPQRNVLGKDFDHTFPTDGPSVSYIDQVWFEVIASGHFVQHLLIYCQESKVKNEEIQ